MDQISIYHVEPFVRTLGPGGRFAVWVQGCPFRCTGCIAPDSQMIHSNRVRSIDSIVEQILDGTGLEGITISGGEPFAQSSGVARLIEKLKRLRPKLSVMIFSGFTLKQLCARKDDATNRVLKNTDILVAGTYKRDLACDDVWRASTNQQVHWLSNRYSPNDMKRSRRELEVFKALTSNDLFVAGIPRHRNFNSEKLRIFTINEELLGGVRGMVEAKDD